MSTRKVDIGQKNYILLSMTPEQTRAARGWLGWSQVDLAQRARVGLSTLKDFESGNRTPIANNLDAIQRALEAAGVKFSADSVSGPLNRNGAGVGPAEG